MRLDMVPELRVSWYWYCWCPLLAPASRTGCGAMARLSRSRGCDHCQLLGTQGSAVGRTLSRKQRRAGCCARLYVGQQHAVTSVRARVCAARSPAWRAWRAWCHGSRAWVWLPQCGGGPPSCQLASTAPAVTSCNLAPAATWPGQPSLRLHLASTSLQSSEKAEASP